ncbi:MAG: hypothetical protein JOY62_15825 [Acidobacteriaceae bacterium]|nr:hypothetical protein [Acidobacteriaceae bacterium]MBV9781433.1 hypothetical protein [Acidobacteriaceae bacterium]
MDTTAHDLKLLTIGYYIQGGIIGFYSLLVLGYFGFLATFLSELSKTNAERGVAIPPAIIPIISVVIGIAVLIAIAWTGCLFLAGYWLARRTNKVFIYVIAALSCLAIPYGTVLGVFTFMVMQRPAAQEIFRRQSARIGPPLPPAETAAATES